MIRRRAWTIRICGAVLIAWGSGLGVRAEEAGDPLRPLDLQDWLGPSRAPQQNSRLRDRGEKKNDAQWVGDLLKEGSHALHFAHSSSGHVGAIKSTKISGTAAGLADDAGHAAQPWETTWRRTPGAAADLSDDLARGLGRGAGFADDVARGAGSVVASAGDDVVRGLLKVAGVGGAAAAGGAALAVAKKKK